MQFLPTQFEDAWLIEPECHADERGMFARTWCEQEFAERRLNPRLVQCNASFNHHARTLRGMHLQRAPHEEAKLVRCIRGQIYDVIVDLRPESSTYLAWQAFELTAENRLALYVPEGFAHGFITLTDNSEVFYQMSEFFHADCSQGFRWNDPTLGIEWPMEPLVISARDANFADYVPRPITRLPIFPCPLPLDSLLAIEEGYSK